MKTGNTIAAGTVVVIGIDGGGTKTVAVLADANGRELARSVGAGANLQTVGAGVVRERIGSLIGNLLSSTTGAVKVRGLAVSLAGVDRPADVPVATDAILGAIADFTAAGQSTPDARPTAVRAWMRGDWCGNFPVACRSSRTMPWPRWLPVHRPLTGWL